MLLPGCAIDLPRATVSTPVATVALTTVEVALLKYLADADGRVIPRDELLRQVWGWRPGLQTRAVDAAVLRLRKKIERDPTSPEALLSVHGRGYRLVVPPPEVSGPIPSAGLIGRDRELERLARRGARVVLVHGTGGVGKSALARAFVAALEAAVPRSTAWVDVTGVTTAPAMLAAIAAAFGLPIEDADEARAGTRLARVVSRLSVVVLDGADAGIEAAAAVARQVTAVDAPSFVVITSRFSAADLPSIEVAPLTQDEAVALFALRAREVSPGWRADDAVGPLVDRLDRLPLAIELAAARVATFPPKALLARIEKRFELLGAKGTLPGLEAVVAWSWTLLDQAERTALVRWSHLVEPFDLDTAEAMLPDQPASTLLEHLAAASLIRAEGGRWRLFDHVMAYARHRATDEERELASYLRRRWFAGRAAAVDRRARAAWARHARGDLEAILAEWPIDPESAARAASALVTLSNTFTPEHRKHVLGLGLEATSVAGDPTTAVALHLARAVARRQAADREGADFDLSRASELASTDRTRAEVLHARGRDARAMGSLEAAGALLAEAARVWRTVGDPLGEAAVAVDAGAVARRRGDFPAAREALLQAVAWARAGDADGLLGMALTNLASVRNSQGEYRDALALLAEARAALERAGDLMNLAICLSTLGNAQFYTDALEEALVSQTESLRLHRQIGSHLGEAYASANRAAVLSALGSQSAAEADLLRALSIHQEVGDRLAESFCWTVLGEARLADGRLEAALDALERAVRIGTEVGGIVEVPALASHATALRLLGRIPEAERAVARALSRAPADPSHAARRAVAFAAAHLALARGVPWDGVVLALLAETRLEDLDALASDVAMRSRWRLLQRG